MPTQPSPEFPVVAVGRVHKKQSSERPEGLTTERAFRLLLDHGYVPPSVGQLAGCYQAGQPGADHDHLSGFPAYAFDLPAFFFFGLVLSLTSSRYSTVIGWPGSPTRNSISEHLAG